RVLLDDFDARELRLVADEREQLGEGPRVEHPPGLGGPLAALANPGEPFDMQYAAGLGDEIHDRPADLVIHVGRPPRLAALGPLHHPGLALLLECPAIAEVAPPDIPERLAVEERRYLRACQDGKIGEPEIEAEMRSLTFRRRNILAPDREHQEVAITLADDLGGAVRTGDVRPEDGRRDDRQPQEAVGRRDADHAAIGEDPQVLGGEPERESLAERRRRGPAIPLATLQVTLAGLDRLVAGLLDRRGREPETATRLAV